jgi:hypothetical protein
LYNNPSSLFGHLAQRSNEAVAPAGNSLYEPGRISRIAQSRPESLHCRVKAVLKVDVGVGGPEPFLQFLARDHFTGTLEKHSEKLYGLPLKLDPEPMPAQFAGLAIELEGSESENSGCGRRSCCYEPGHGSGHNSTIPQNRFPEALSPSALTFAGSV